MQPGAGVAQDRATGHVWETVPEVTTADLAAHGWTVAETAGLTLPSGGQAVVSFWEHRVYNSTELMRCITAFDAELNQLADVCARATHPTLALP